MNQLKKYQDETLGVTIAAGIVSTYMPNPQASALVLVGALVVWGFVLRMFSLSDCPEGDKHV